MMVCALCSRSDPECCPRTCIVRHRRVPVCLPQPGVMSPWGTGDQQGQGSPSSQQQGRSRSHPGSGLEACGPKCTLQQTCKQRHKLQALASDTAGIQPL